MIAWIVAPGVISVYSCFRGQCIYKFDFLNASVTGKKNVSVIDNFLTNRQAPVSSEALKQTCHATRVEEPKGHNQKNTQSVKLKNNGKN